MHGYMVDAYHLIDYINKEKPNIDEVEIYIRNHMYPGSFDKPTEDFKERDERPFHMQTSASNREPCSAIDMSMCYE